MGRRDDKTSETHETRQERAEKTRERRLVDPARTSPGELPADDVVYQLWRLVYSIRNMLIAWWIVTIIAAVFVVAEQSTGN